MEGLGRERPLRRGEGRAVLLKIVFCGTQSSWDPKRRPKFVPQGRLLGLVTRSIQ